MYGLQVLLFLALYMYAVAKEGREDTEKQPASEIKRHILLKSAMFYSIFVIWSVLGWGILQQGTIEEGIIWAALFVPALLVLLGFILGAVSFFLGYLPLKFLVLSIHELVTKRTWAGLAGTMGSLATLGIASTIILLPLSVDPVHSGASSKGAFLAAAFGLPGEYRIEDELIHTVTVCIVWAAIATFAMIVIVNRLRRKRSLKNKHSEQGL